MNDPYKTPQSDVEVNQLVSKTRWKVFFWIIVLLELASIVFMIIDPEETFLDIIIELAIYSIVILGIFGFAFDRRIFSKRLWISIIPIVFSYDIFSFIKLDWTFGSPEEMYFTVGFVAVVAIPLLYFQYLALYKYGFKSPEIWQKSI